MKKVSFSLVFLMSVLFIFVLSSKAHASSESVTFNTYLPKKGDIGINAEIGPKYPGTNVYLMPGDIIHNPKSTSTYFVGHIAIVGPDLKLRHSHPYGPGISDTLESYIERFQSGDKFTILRPRGGGGAAAAAWSRNNVNNIRAYNFIPGVRVVGDNYCSKFVWQAYYFGEHRELVSNAPYSDLVTPIGLLYVYPTDILNSPILAKQGTFYR